MKHKGIITIDTSKRFEKPIIRGTRITVTDVLNWLANGMSKAEIIRDFPELTEEMIHAALRYAANREDHLGHAS